MHTVNCENCHAKNTVDGGFCRQCGAPLPEDQRQQVKEEANRLLADGRLLLNDGRSHEAVMVAESVLEVDPSNADALSLLGDIYEKDGQIAEALETYERVCEIRPDSAIDRIRLAHLRKLMAAQELAIDVPGERRRGLMLVAAAGILLLSVGAAFFFASSTPSQPDPNLVASADAPDVEGFSGLTPTLVPNVPNGKENRAVPDGTGGADAQPQPTTRANIPDPLQPPRSHIGFARSSVGGSVGPYNPQPNLPDWSSQVSITPSGQEPSTGSSTTAEPVDDPDATEEPKEDPGIIEIKKTPGSGDSSAGSGAQSVDDLIRKARNLYIQEDYSGAARLYEQAIGMGAQTGATYQRLAQCYQRLGRRGDAISAYKKAVSTYEAQISRGGGSASVKAAKESCEKAIDALGG